MNISAWQAYSIMYEPRLRYTLLLFFEVPASDAHGMHRNGSAYDAVPLLSHAASSRRVRVVSVFMHGITSDRRVRSDHAHCADARTAASSGGGPY